LFDRNSGRCALPEKAPCGIVNGSPTDPGRPTCVGNTGQTSLPFTTDCTRYLVCIDEEEVFEGDCGPDLVFNSDAQVCDRSENYV
jgi:hypothetical protein